MGWSWNVRVALHSSELYALDMLSPMSWRVWMLGVGAVYVISYWADLPPVDIE